MKLLPIVFWTFIALFPFACAKQTGPTGGPKDTIPPILTHSTPKHEAINFDGNKIELEFSEPVQLNTPKEQLLITPSINKDYEIITRKNKVIITLAEPLQDSTTYTFNFREAVQDITERNAARNLKIALSTGTYIDSLSVEGNIFGVLDQKPIKDGTVALEPHSDTFDIFKHIATYFTRTDEKGNYKLENLKPGRYIAYALSDNNKNLIVDSKSEQYGFKTKPITLDSSLIAVNIGLVKLDARPLRLSSARPYNTYFNIKTTKNLKAYKLSGEKTTHGFGTDRANVLIYNTFNKDSVKLTFTAEDSIDNRIDTALWVKFLTRQTTPEKFSIALQKQRILADRGTMSFEVTFSKPLGTFNLDSIFYKVDSLNTIRFTKENLTYDEPTRVLKVRSQIDKNLFPVAQSGTEFPNSRMPSPSGTTDDQPKPINQLYLGKGAFISVEQDTSTMLSESIRPLRYEELGVIIAETKPTKDKLIIQLLDLKYQVIQETVGKNSTTFEDLSPGDYFLRIVVDKNGNGKWDTGNYLKKQEPEEIHYYKNEKGVREIKLKANFELGPLLITY